MGSVYRRKDGRWVGKYQDLEGSWRYLYRKSKQEAKQALLEALRDLEEGISPSKITVQQYLVDWLQDQQGVVSERTLLVKRVNLETHIYPALGDKRLSKLTAKDVRCVFKGKDLKPATMNKILGTFSQALNDSVGRHIRVNPCKEIKRIRQSREEMRVLSPSEMRTLLSAARGDRFKGIIVLGATCGLRMGEIVGLKWSDLDPAKGTLSIKRTIWRNRVLPTKTNSSRRTIKLPKIALEALHQHTAKGDADWIFATANNNPVDASNFYRDSWRKVLRMADLPYFNFHQLRHCAASFLLSQRVPITVVSRFLGHANPQITLAVYSHMIDDDLGLAADTMDGLLG